MSDTVDQSRLYPRVTSFRFRRGTLTPGQRRNWENLWPTLGRDLLTSPGADGKVAEPPLDAAQWFGRTAPLILEIGSGTGISTAAMAADEPQFDVVAVEVYQPGLAQLVGLVDRGGLENVRMIRGDAVVVLDELIERKKAFDEEMLKPIDELLARTLTIDAGPGIAKSQRKIRTWLIWNADAVRDALAPFDSGIRPAPSGDGK